LKIESINIEQTISQVKQAIAEDKTLSTGLRSSIELLLLWSSPDFTDTYKKTDNGPGGVQWKSAENSAESSNMKLYN